MQVTRKRLDSVDGVDGSEKRIKTDSINHFNHTSFDDDLNADAISSISSLASISSLSDDEVTPNTTFQDDSLCTVDTKPASTGPANALNEKPRPINELPRLIMIHATVDGDTSIKTAQTLDTSKRTAQHILTKFWKTPYPPATVDYRKRCRRIHGTRCVNAVMGHIAPDSLVKAPGSGCYRCESGKGPFTTCVVHPYPTFARSVGACTGCLFDGVGARCSLAESTCHETSSGSQWRKDVGYVSHVRNAGKLIQSSGGPRLPDDNMTVEDREELVSEALLWARYVKMWSEECPLMKSRKKAWWINGYGVSTGCVELYWYGSSRFMEIAVLTSHNYIYNLHFHLLSLNIPIQNIH